MAADEGHLKILKYLAESTKFDFLQQDRWGNSTISLIEKSNMLSEGEKAGMIELVLKRSQIKTKVLDSN